MNISNNMVISHTRQRILYLATFLYFFFLFHRGKRFEQNPFGFLLRPRAPVVYAVQVGELPTDQQCADPVSLLWLQLSDALQPARAGQEHPGLRRRRRPAVRQPHHPHVLVRPYTLTGPRNSMVLDNGTLVSMLS